jgi:translation initiation factor 2B subunit (eIF-2B alpha/beta/delta family)
MSEPTPVVTAFLRNRAELFVCRRSDVVDTFAGRWAGVSGAIEDGEEPIDAARRELREETGLAAVERVRAGRPFTATEGDHAWRVHPFLFDCPTRDIDGDAAAATCEWVHPTALLDRETVPDLWYAYTTVAPTVNAIAADDEHGAAYLSVRALAVLRDRAGQLRSEDATPDAAWDELADLARRLTAVRPSMAVLATRVDAVMYAATETEQPPSAATVERAAIDGIERASAADEETAAHAAERTADATVLTLSRSGTLLSAFERGPPARLFVAESRPAREGVAVAERLADTCPVTLSTDAAVGHVLAANDVDCVLVGADTVLADGRVVNKTGTRTLSLAAAHEGVPVYAVAATAKITPATDTQVETGPRDAVYDGAAAIDVSNPTFDVTPADAITGVVTECGVLDTAAVADVADDHAAYTDWPTHQPS